MSETTIDRALASFKLHHGWLRTGQALELGIAPRTLYALRDSGLIIRENRGLFRLTDAPPPAYPDLIQVSLKISKGIICLISVLAFHGVTTQIPHQVYLALPNDAEKPRLDFPPLRLFWLSEKSYSVGVEERIIEGIPVKMYSIEKTIADCFKFRKKIGADIAIEALTQCIRDGRCHLSTLVEYAQVNRVEKIIQPYLEILV
ncbi:MAG: type IV toxin-antitoxin system AbiEi family antitoxin domain-containing protein [Anaerolineaceae bacterium]|nr:type IV toxin-antitoxin system AbiEi family antitoxin domain-containing protein [Anaerolineaceae bacterium]